MKNWLPGEIVALRKKHGLSQGKLSLLLGVTNNYVYMLEKGVKRPSKTLRLLLDCVDRQLNETATENAKEKDHVKGHLSSR